jgi:type IV pilus assembly protein PilE
MKSTISAFVLVEMMVVVALLGILLAMIVPGYQQQVLNSYRFEATQELLRLAVLQQQYYLEQQNYTATLSLLAAPDDNYLTASGRYRISAQVSAQGFMLEAEAVGPQRKDLACQWLRLDQTGRKFSSPTADCWHF